MPEDQSPSKSVSLKDSEARNMFVMCVDFGPENFTELTSSIKQLVKVSTEGQGDFVVENCDSIQLRISIKMNQLNEPIILSLVNLHSNKGDKGSAGTL
jgi:hypothetical protein